MLQGTHDLKRCKFTVAGRRIHGFGSNGDAVAIAFDDQNYIKKIGADGEGGRNKTNNRAGTYTVTIHQTNTEMIRFLDGIMRTPSPGDVVPVAFVNPETGERCASAQAWIQAEPERTFHKESGERVYVFDTAAITVQI